MATKVFYDNMVSTAKLAEFSAEQSVETEILLADYDFPVFKIVKTTMDHAVTQKYVTNNKLVIEGFIKLCIYYQPPGGEKLNVITQRIPFQKQQEINAGQTDIYTIKVTGNCQYVNTRPQNPTRIDVRGAYLFNIKVYGKNDTRAVTAVSGNSVCADSEEAEYFCMSGQSIRQFTIEDELELAENTQKILRVHSYTVHPAVTAYQDKVSAKGQVMTDIFYTTQQNGEIQKYTHIFLYNQVMDMQGVRENHIAYVDVNVNNVSVSQNTDSKKYIANVTVQLDVTAFAKQQMITVTDAFSRNFACHREEQMVLLDKNIYQTDKSWHHKFTAEIAEGCVAKHIIMDIAPVKSYFEINKTTVKAKLNAYIIAQNPQNEYECTSYSEDIVLSWLEDCGQYDEIAVKLLPAEYSFSQSGNRVMADVVLSAYGFVIEKQQMSVLENFEENTEAPITDKEQALVIYYGQKGEKLFDIAKSHRADPQLIMEENNIKAKELPASQMIFIPVFD